MSNDTDRSGCLCLSGGGFRATLFHLGALQRLNELGVLSQVSTLTSVSGGSILNGLLATRWAHLERRGNGEFANLIEIIAEPMRRFCTKDLRTEVLIGTRLKPSNWLRLVRDGFSVSANYLAEAYEPFYEARLSDLPEAKKGVPRFIFCATNVRSGACFHFHGGPNARMGDFYTGYCDARDIRLSEAVAASSAFPPGFGAIRLPLDPSTLSRVDPWGETRPLSEKRNNRATNDNILLTDGGVYDNLAVEPIWKTYRTVLVSDAGSPFQSEAHSSQDIVRRLKRAAEISMEQVGAVRKRWLVEDFTLGRREGAIWTVHTRMDAFPLDNRQGYGQAACKSLQKIRTDLDAFTDAEIKCLENHGYALADAALRSRAPNLCPNLGAPFQWPHPDWIDEDAVVLALERSNTRLIARDVFRYVLELFVGRTDTSRK